jgi:hypothetical protein
MKHLGGGGDAPWQVAHGPSRHDGSVAVRSRRPSEAGRMMVEQMHTSTDLSEEFRIVAAGPVPMHIAQDMQWQAPVGLSSGGTNLHNGAISSASTGGGAAAAVVTEVEGFDGGVAATWGPGEHSNTGAAAASFRFATAGALHQNIGSGQSQASAAAQGSAAEEAMAVEEGEEPEPQWLSELRRRMPKRRRPALDPAQLPEGSQRRAVAARQVSRATMITMTVAVDSDDSDGDDSD